MLTGVARPLFLDKGFTLVEMMVAIAILVIVMAIAAPNLQTFILNARVRSAGESLMSGINLARMEAVQRNARVSVWIVDNLTASCQLTTTGTSWVVSLDDPTDLCHSAASVAVDPRLVQARTATEGGGNITVTADGFCVTFNGFGAVEPTCTGGQAPSTQIAVDPPNGSAARSIQIDISTNGGARLQ